jgi:hypothetical protein
MKRLIPATIAVVLMLAVPALASAQSRAHPPQQGTSAGRATPPAGGQRATPPPPTSSGTQADRPSGGSSRPNGGNSGSSGAAAAPRPSGSGTSSSAVGRDGSGASAQPAATRRTPTDDSLRYGTAVPRTAGSAPGGTVIVPAWYYYSPYIYGYGAFGLGYWYAPYFWDGDPYGFGWDAPYDYARIDRDYGSIKLKVKPNDAEVYVDGYYVGQVDEFDGIFQHLDLEAGSHRIEVRAAGYQPETIDVLIYRGRSVTYKGKLQPAGEKSQRR